MSELTNLMSGIAGSIRGKTGEPGKLRPAEFAGEIDGLAGKGQMLDDAGKRYDVEDIRTEKIYGKPDLAQTTNIIGNKGFFDQDGNLYLCYQKNVKKLNDKDEVVWSIEIENSISKIDEYDDMVLITTDNTSSGATLYFYNLDGTEARRLNQQWGYCIDNIGTIYIIGVDKKTITKILPDGSAQWSYTMSHEADYIVCSSESVFAYHPGSQGTWVDETGNLIGKPATGTFFLRDYGWGTDWVVVSEDGYLYGCIPTSATSCGTHKLERKQGGGETKYIWGVSTSRYFKSADGTFNKEEILCASENGPCKLNTKTGRCEIIKTLEYPKSVQKGNWLYILHTSKRMLMRVNNKTFELEHLDMPDQNETDVKIFVDDVEAVWIIENQPSFSSSMQTYISASMNGSTETLYQNTKRSYKLTDACSYKEKTYLLFDSVPAFRVKHAVAREWQSAIVKKISGGGTLIE